MIKSIMKRDGRVVLYDESKISVCHPESAGGRPRRGCQRSRAGGQQWEARLEELCGDGTPRIRADSGHGGAGADARRV